jgi:biopolymer transport protein ExbD
MKFPRNVRVFKGELNAAPLVGVFFLLLLFVVFASLVHTPGILVKLDGSSGQTNGLPIFVTVKGDAVFNGQTNSPSNLDRLRRDLGARPGAVFSVRSEPGAPRDAVQRVRDLVRDAGRIELPSATGLASTTNRTVAVAVNVAGQLFFRNKLVTEAELAKHLRDAVNEQPAPLAIVLLMDRQVDIETQTRIALLATEAGAKELLNATRARLFDSARPGPEKQ